MKQKRVTETDINNIMTEDFLYKRFKLLALNMFKWTGLEALGVEERHVENWLCDYGQFVVFKDKYYGLMALKGHGYGNNVLEDPTHYRVEGNRYTKEIPAEECVLVENNKLRMPTREVLAYFTNQLYEVVRSRDVNVKTLKLPFVALCTDKNVLTVKKIMESINNNDPCIVIDKDIMNIDDFKILQTGVKPYTAELTDLYHDIMNEALTYLGINNANTDKKERLITSEADANNQLIECCAEMFLEARKRACESINEMFGTNISVELRNKGVEGNAFEYDSEYTSGQQQSDNA